MTVTSGSNCDTDRYPFVPEVEFRCYEGTPDAEASAVGSAILFAGYCGALAEFEGVRVSLDTARAVRQIMPDIEELVPIDGAKREIGQGVSTLIVGEARCMYGADAKPRVGTSARAITWSGDFVGPGERDSTTYIGGDVFTNARLVAGSTEVSVALALFVGGRSVRDIYVPPPPPEELAAFERVAAGLEHISIKLRSL